ncbi:MAG: ACP phosphodiesterase, partial [Chitinophagaceae bacterium]
EDTYKILSDNEKELPIVFLKMLPHMQQQNWLFNYQFIWGIEKSFEGLVRRANYLDTHKEALQAFQDNYIALQNCYDTFFPDVLTFAKSLVQK